MSFLEPTTRSRGWQAATISRTNQRNTRLTAPVVYSIRLPRSALAICGLLMIELSASGQVCYQFSDAQNGQPPTTVATVTISAIPASLTGPGASGYGAGFTSASSLSNGGANSFIRPRTS